MEAVGITDERAARGKPTGDQSLDKGRAAAGHLHPGGTQQIEAGLMVHRTTLATTAGGLAARIHSDGTTDTTLGLRGSPLRSLSFLLLGRHRPGTALRGEHTMQ